MGRRLKISHLAHLICELYVRLKVVNRTTGLSFRLPLTQAELADVLGLSVVHMNRIVGDLRKLGAVTWADQSLTIMTGRAFRRSLNSIRPISVWCEIRGSCRKTHQTRRVSGVVKPLAR